MKRHVYLPSFGETTGEPLEVNYRLMVRHLDLRSARQNSEFFTTLLGRKTRTPPVRIR